MKINVDERHKFDLMLKYEYLAKAYTRAIFIPWLKPGAIDDSREFTKKWDIHIYNPWLKQVMSTGSLTRNLYLVEPENLN
ncbi:hypothetical protein LRS05_08190 [Flavobacterium sp. J372]|uniref:hypothetical protein n=1 Tax=Flavobacterium sp. J372 TaxID=2898436 RepID=UPI0021517612|nr:hypothetical protein [Flavobacterium sp. J372]MCR5862122.1 hypothetical protein [Flavobacterium sp. J372]